LTYTTPETEATTRSGQGHKLPRIGGQVYLPASAIRGRLRRMARNAVVYETGKKLDFTDFYFLTVGGLNNEKGEESKTEAKESYAVQVIQTVERYNPLISLFGAGPGSPVAIPSKLSITHAFAQNGSNPVSVVSPCRTDDARTLPAETQELIDDSFFDEYLVQVVGQREGAKLKARQKELQRELKKEGSDKDAIRLELNEIENKLKAKPVSISNPGLQYEVINPGVPLRVSMRVVRANEREMALLMRAFKYFAFEPVFGAKKAEGNGLVSGSFKILLREGRTDGFQEAGYIEWDGDYTGLTRVEGIAKKWLEMALPYNELRFDYKTVASVLR